MAELSGANGYLTGLFFLIYNFNVIVGNSIVLIASALGSSITTLFTILTAIAGCGTILIFFAPSPPALSHSTSGPPARTAHITTTQTIKQILGAAKLPALQLMMPQMAYQGTAQTFSMGVLPQLIGGTVSDRAYMFLAYGFVGCICSLVYGKMFDRWGWEWLAGVQVGATMLLHAVTLGIYFAGLDPHWYVLSGAIASLVDNAANSLNNMTISKVAWARGEKGMNRDKKDR